MGSSSKGAGHCVRGPHVTFLYPPVRKALPVPPRGIFPRGRLIVLTIGLSGLSPTPSQRTIEIACLSYGRAEPRHLADPIIAIANTAGAGLAATVLACKVRDTRIGEN